LMRGRRIADSPLKRSADAGNETASHTWRQANKYRQAKDGNGTPSRPGRCWRAQSPAEQSTADVSAGPSLRMRICFLRALPPIPFAPPCQDAVIYHDLAREGYVAIRVIWAKGPAG
jgi:hypothetical protein